MHLTCEELEQNFKIINFLFQLFPQYGFLRNMAYKSIFITILYLKFL